MGVLCVLDLILRRTVPPGRLKLFHRHYTATAALGKKNRCQHTLFLYLVIKYLWIILLSSLSQFPLLCWTYILWKLTFSCLSLTFARLGSIPFMVGFNDLKALFQPKWLHDSGILFPRDTLSLHSMLCVSHHLPSPKAKATVAAVLTGSSTGNIGKAGWQLLGIRQG